MTNLSEEIVSTDRNIRENVGEMNAEQLWETTMNPATRKLKRIDIEDGVMADKITSVLMGNEVAPRKDFIIKKAKEANLDI